MKLTKDEEILKLKRNIRSKIYYTKHKDDPTFILKRQKSDKEDYKKLKANPILWEKEKKRIRYLRKKNPEKFKIIRKRYEEKIGKVILTERSKNYQQKLKNKVLEYYSDKPPYCACCGEINLEFLSIDHINGNGNKHRKQIRTTMYRWLINNNYPDEYRVLCMNCNFSMGKFGYCPHKKEEIINEVVK